MVIGVTGSRGGSPPAQWSTVTAVLAGLTKDAEHGVVHHGGCVGFDESVHRWCAMDAIPWTVVVHPGDSRDDMKAECPNADNLRVIRERAKNNRARNQDIVNETDVLVAAPPGPEKSFPRSGTWMTVRMALKAGKPVVVVMPDGRTIHEEVVG